MKHAVGADLDAFLLEHMTARLCVLDRNQRFLFANRELLEFLHRPAAEVIGCKLATSRRSSPCWLCPLAERVFAGEALRLEGWAEFPGEGQRYFTESFIPYGRNGAIEMVAVFGRDHIDLKLRERDLAAASTPITACFIR